MQIVLKLSQVADFSGVGNNISEAVLGCGFWEVLTPTKFVSENFIF